MLDLEKDGWVGRRALVTGGASFIGSHLTDALLARGARVRVVDNLTSGRIENLRQHRCNKDFQLIQADLREPGITREAMEKIDVVFHAAERVDSAAAINLGTMERVRVIDAARAVPEYTGHKAEIRLLPNMPTGPRNRVADNRLARQLLDWEPKTCFAQGLRRTVDWYYGTKKRPEVKETLDRMLTER